MKEENKKNQESEKNQEEGSKKDAVSLLREIGLKEVSNKTFINLDNLTALLDKDFVKLNKIKALGFIQILQREFDVDLNELKNEYLQFYNSHKKPKENQPILTPTDEDEEKPKKFLSYILLGLAALLVAYFLFSNGGKSESMSSMDLNVVKNNVVTEEAKESLLALDEVYEKEINDSDEVDLNKVVQEMFKNVEDNESNLSEEETSSTELVDVTESQMIMPAVEENITLEPSIIEAVTSVKVVEKPVEEVEKLVIPKKPKKSPAVTNENKGGLYIKPIRKAWVGVIFLDSMKKKDFLIRRTLQLDASKDQIILIGHKNFKIFNKQLERGFKSKQKVMFLYKDGDLREISESEYNRYRGGVRW